MAMKAMTKKIFWQDAYLTNLETSVIQVDGCDVVLESTIFYAESGGQESDQGTIGGWPVHQAKKNDQDIVYTEDQGHELKVGDFVNVKIDGNRRYKLMRLHFAAEIVLELFYKTQPGIEKIGAHISETKARIDFLRQGSIASLLNDIRQKAIDLIQSDQPIISAFSDENAQRRYWMIDGFSKVPCGGTHLKRTSEIGSIRLKRENVGKGKERVEIFLDGTGPKGL